MERNDINNIEEQRFSQQQNYNQQQYQSGYTNPKKKDPIILILLIIIGCLMCYCCIGCIFTYSSDKGKEETIDNSEKVTSEDNKQEKNKNRTDNKEQEHDKYFWDDNDNSDVETNSKESISKIETDSIPERL